jgi:HAD superfamily hydrolase (TIGR01509 family)
MIKALFWDNDGVLVDTERLYFLATQQMLATVGISLTQERYVELFLVQGKGAWHLAVEKGLAAAVDQLRRGRNALYRAALQQQTLVLDGVPQVLDALHGTYAMGIVTSSEPDHFALIHQKTGLLPYFQFALTAADYTHTKPHPEPYLLAVERSGFDKEECLVIEDSERGLTAAREAGLRCVVIPSDLTRGGNFVGAYRVLQRVTDLVDVLQVQPR